VNMKRRRFERHAFRLPVTVRWAGREERATSRTLGLGGMFVALPDPPPVGTMLALTLTLATPRKRDEVTLQGEVAYADATGIGVRFVGTPADVRARLRGFFLLQDLHCFNTEPPPAA